MQDLQAIDAHDVLPFGGILDNIAQEVQGTGAVGELIAWLKICRPELDRLVFGPVGSISLQAAGAVVEGVI